MYLFSNYYYFYLLLLQYEDTYSCVKLTFRINFNDFFITLCYCLALPL